MTKIANNDRILVIDNTDDEAFLRKQTRPFSFDEFSRSELKKLVAHMRRVMKGASGVGLSANQIGFDFNMFVAEYDDKFYAVFNPELTKLSEKAEVMEEGCLSIPGKFGPIERSLRVTLEGQNIEGRKIKIRARGFLAKIFQHEVDHLNGTLFIDNAESVHDTPASARLQEKHPDA